jgi:pimeloyl-ACP methyl ester carboxylesterase
MPLGIDGQLDFVEGFLQHHAGPNTKVILMGHSLGAYLIMEILQRHQIPSTLTSYSVIGAVGLFPAVVHLAQSEGGKQALRLLNFPFLPLIATLFVRALCILPAVLLQYLIILFFGYPEDAATFTVRWLKSPWGFSESM